MGDEVTDHDLAGATWRRPSRRQVLAFAGLGTATAVLPGCAMFRSDEDTAPPPVAGGRLTMAQQADVQPKAPVSQSIFNQSWRRLVYNTLIRLDREKVTLATELATGWEETRDGTYFRFPVVSGATWHSGRPFSAEDVVFTMRTMASDPALPFPFKWLLATLVDVRATGGAVEMTFSANPRRALFDMLDMMIIIDRESVEGFVAGTTHVGTGPFRWVGHRPGEQLLLERNVDYWRSGRPYLDSVAIDVAEAGSMVDRLRSGDVQVGLNLPPQDLTRFESERAFAVTQYDTFGQGLYLAANVTVPPLDKRATRLAINFAVDRERINEQVFRGRALATSAPWSPKSPAFDPTVASRYAHDLDRARQLLGDADAVGTTVALEVAPSVQSAAAVADLIAGDLDELGLRIRTVLLDPAQQSERFAARTYEGLFVGVHGYNQLSPPNLFNSAAPFRPRTNLSNFVDADYEESVAAAMANREESNWDRVTATLLDEAFCCDLVVTANNAVTRGLSGWDYTLWDEVRLDDAFLVDP